MPRLTAIVAIFGFATVANAEPLSLQEISADAKWVAHLDVDALLASKIAQKARRHVLENFPQVEEHLTMLVDVWNFDPATDLHGITIYGSQLKRKTGVAIVHANVDQKMLLEKANAAPGHQAITYGKYELHSWNHAVNSKHERTMTGVFYKPDIMVFGASPEEVKAALDVLDGSKPNFTGKETGLSLSIPSGVILVAGAVGLTESDLPYKSPLAKKTDALVLAVGEETDGLFVVGQMMAQDPQTSQEIKAVIDGGLALAKIAKSEDDDLLKLINAVHVTADGKAVNVEWRAPVDEVWKGTQKMIAEAQKANKNWREHGKSKAEDCPVNK